jgi:hypothetical protein
LLTDQHSRQHEECDGAQRGKNPGSHRRTADVTISEDVSPGAPVARRALCYDGCMTVELPGEIAAGLAAIAAAEGRSPEEYLRELVEREVQRKRPLESRAALFRRLKAEAVAAGVPQLDDDELQAEIREYRGLGPEDED